MGMFDNIKCEYPLPDKPIGARNWQTKSFGDGMVGGFMDNYTITPEGKLILHKCTYETVPEEERPYYGTPDWDKNLLMQICGSMKSTPLEDEDQEYHGVINIYTNTSNNEWVEYDIKFTDGVVTEAKRIYREFG